MPGFYPEDEYDLAGFCVGLADKSSLVDGQNLAAGDALIAVASSGVHSNGFSLVRKVFDVNGENLARHYDELSHTLGEELLTPTKIYVKALGALMSKIDVHAISHITGGGFYENIPRMLGGNCRAVIEKDKVRVLPIFDLIQKIGGISEHDMFNTFNMGAGLCIAVAPDKADEAVRILSEAGETAYVMGEIKDGECGVELI